MYNNVIRGYKDPKNFASEAFKLSIRRIDPNKDIAIVPKAAELKLVTMEEFNGFKAANSIE